MRRSRCPRWRAWRRGAWLPTGALSERGASHRRGVSARRASSLTESSLMPYSLGVLARGRVRGTKLAPTQGTGQFCAQLPPINRRELYSWQSPSTRRAIITTTRPPIMKPPRTITAWPPTITITGGTTKQRSMLRPPTSTVSMPTNTPRRPTSSPTNRYSLQERGNHPGPSAPRAVPSQVRARPVPPSLRPPAFPGDAHPTVLQESAQVGAVRVVRMNSGAQRVVRLASTRSARRSATPRRVLRARRLAHGAVGRRGRLPPHPPPLVCRWRRAEHITRGLQRHQDGRPVFGLDSLD